MANTVELNLGAVATVLSATSTRLRCKFTTAPTVATPPGTLRARVTNSKGTSAEVTIAKVQPPVGHWPLNEGSGTTLNDISANANHLAPTAIGTPRWDADTPGAQAGPGGCLQSAVYIDIDHTGDLVLFKSNSTGMPAGNAPRSVTFWFKALSGDVINLMYLAVNDLARTLTVRYSRSCNMSTTIFLDKDINGNALEVGRAPATANAWHHYAFTWDGSSWKYYEDGVLADSGTLVPLNSESNMVEISMWANNGQTVRMKDVRMYDRALTAGEILAMQSL